MAKAAKLPKIPVEPPKLSGPSVWALVLLHEHVDMARSKDTIIGDVRSRMPGCLVYLPMHEEKIGGRNYYTVLYDSYFFIRHDGSQDFETKLKKLHSSTVEGPLLSNGKLSYKLGSFIDKLKEQARERATSYTPEQGELVTCLHEALGRMDGLVIDVDMGAKIATVKIVMRSREIIASVKFSNIERKEDDFDTTLEWMRTLD